MLDPILEDRVIEVGEAEESFAFACECGIPPERIVELHERYLATLVSLVLSDGIVTDDERRDLNRVAAPLAIDIDTIDRLLSNPSGSNAVAVENLSGKTVCFHGAA